MEPMSWDVTQLLGRLSGVDSGAKGDTAFEVLRNDQFFCHYDEFAEWAGGRKQLPVLKGRQPLGRALGGEIQAAIRDTGSWMDPRAKKDWWQGK